MSEADSSNQNADEAAEAEAEITSPMDLLQSLLKKFKLKPDEEEEPEEPEKLLDECSVDGVARYILSDKCKNIVVMCGAGISTAAGIPDFRTPGTGLYDNLQKYELKNPTDIFEINFFKKNPQPFFTLAKELFPGNYKPTTGHRFLKLLDDKGKLRRVYTQNIDGLEQEAGLSDEKVVAAHGTFFKSHCIDCGHEHSLTWMKEKIFNDEIPYCDQCKEETAGLVKPDIVFFGEALPKRFFDLRYEDFNECDLLIIMGTSLKVQPFASLVGGVKLATPRLLINREKCGETDPMMVLMGFTSAGLDFDSEKAYRDVPLLGDCDDGCRDLCAKLNWAEDLAKLEAEAEVTKSESSVVQKQQSTPACSGKSTKVDFSEPSTSSS